MSAIKRVVCGMSGGIDSCMSALYLKRQRFDVIGVFMRNWDVADEKGECQADKECADAAEICDRLKIPFHEVSFVKEYWNQVFTPLIEDYQNGLTPNPDVLCNRYVKFSSFLDYAREKHGADAIATGHYAQSSFGPSLEKKVPDQLCKMYKGKDPIKDQTLFLSQISQDSLQNTMFPVGGLFKHQVKSQARQAGFKDIVKKRESTGICFIGKRDFGSFMKDYCPENPGRFIDVDSGKVVGRHNGIQFYTIGQRALIGGLNAPYFVAHKDPGTRDILVALKHDNPAMYSDSFEVRDMYWISGVPETPVANQSTSEMDVEFRFQHANPVVPATILFSEDDPEKKDIRVRLRNKLFAITPGQYAVFYMGDQCLGSGRITDSATTSNLREKFFPKNRAADFAIPEKMQSIN